MAWQENLFSNLLVAGILFTLAVIVYCKIRDRTLVDVFKEAKEIMTPEEIIE